ncbi:hypothetical protein [Chryseobacterium vrystaatense]|uniref:Uncharacterized protein n=1 Tax=Chryseobacterium vrystaatense TaxID=307480 RepID=A0A1M5M1V4_9FLAO|nr:hypothetical protein [Chryseobacterium vrystaatense]SHG71241.1 hypothetical protein SAMN02787073_4715 [Chryseobacterium vrystaatense]
MKKLFTILLVLFALKSYSQSYYKNLFDKKHYNTSIGNSNSHDQFEFAWGVPAHMEALMLMYEKTKDTTYANTLIKCIGNTIDRRDDLRDQIPGLFKIYDYRGTSGAAWSHNHYNIKMDSGAAYSHFVHSANILYPMAKFAAMVKKDLTIQNLKYNSSGRYAGQKYIAIANDLVQKVKETLEYHKGQWQTKYNPNSSSIPNDSIGYYKERDSISAYGPPIKYKGVIAPFNMQSAMGRVYVHMYRATEDSVYFKKFNQIANFIKLNTSVDSNLGSYKWIYWNHFYLRDDVSHAGLTVSFPYECFKYNMKNSANDSLYTSLDMERYVKTFTKDIYRGPLSIHDAVNYDGLKWDIKYSKVNNIPTDNDTKYDGYISYMWLYLSSQYDKKIYQIIADLQAAKNYYDHIQVEGSSLTLALLANFENFIVPVNTEHLYGEASDWRGVAKGNFSGGTDEEFVLIRNFDGMMGTMKPYNKGFLPATNSRLCGDITYNWKGLAAGDFFDDNKSEILALSDHTDFNKNGFYIYKIENNQIVEHSKLTGFGADSKWVGAAAGNFISGGKDDFIAVRNYNKEVRVYKFNGAAVELVYFNQLNLPANSKIKAVAAGNLDDDPKDEIVLLVDADDHMQNGVYVYDIDDNGVMTLIDKSIGFGADSYWSGLAVGNLDGVGADEIIAQRNFDGDHKIFQLKKLNGIQFLDNIGLESFPVSQVHNSVMCFGNFDPESQNDELVTLREDGGIVMFSAAKVIKKTSNTNKKSDPCQDELPAELFSLLKSSFILKEKSETIASAQRGK